MSTVSSEIKTYTYPNGEIQRVQVVKFDNFKDLKFVMPKHNQLAYTRLCSLYEDFLVKKYAMIYGKMVIYMVPEDEEIPFSFNGPKGEISDPLAVVTMQFKEHIHCKGDKIVFDDEKVKEYFEYLKSKGLLFVAEGKRKVMGFLPVGRHMGYLSECESDALLKVNSSFFIMDQLDCGSFYDQIGIPIGLMVEDGKIINPPQYERQALLVKNDRGVTVEKVSLKELTVKIGDTEYKHGLNATFFERPAKTTTKRGKTDIVIVYNRVVGINKKGGSKVPTGGFVVQPYSDEPSADILNAKVSYMGMEDCSFAIQVGNSAIVDGVPTDRFISKFYNFMKVYKSSYPPALYPLNYKKARAPRIVLGADSEGRGMLLWYEGAGKFGYKPGEGSCGASLMEAATIAKDLGMKNGVHLDGGGSAQILIDNKKSLKCSDRNPDTFEEKERAIPAGLMLF